QRASTAARSPVGCVGLVGSTVLVAIHDSAIREALPARSDDISALGGVNWWIDDHAGTAVEFLFAPEQASGYLIRIRQRQERGARVREGRHIASFAEHVFDGARPLRSSLRGLEPERD